MMAIYSLFAKVLDYPGRPIDSALDELSRLLLPESPSSCDRIREFRVAVDPMNLRKLEEDYTDAFDLRPEATANLSHHMFGEDARRGVFMAELKGKMMAIGMTLGTEIPDHISLILEYVDRAAEEEKAPLIEECLQPSLKKMDEVLTECGNPYRFLLEALSQFLEHRKPAPAPLLEPAGAARLG